MPTKTLEINTAERPGLTGAVVMLGVDFALKWLVNSMPRQRTHYSRRTYPYQNTSLSG